MMTSKEILALAETTYGDGNFQTIILKILADIVRKLEILERRELIHHGKLK